MNGAKVKLRALEPEDVEILYRWENDRSIWHLSTTIVPLSRFALEQYVIGSGQDLYTSRQLRLIIDLLKPINGLQTIGSIDLFEFEPTHQRAGVGILILKEFRGKGYASEALELLISYAFETLQLHQLFCNISPENSESSRLFESKGFQYVGTKKEWNRVRNNWQDESMFQLINHSHKS
ncbi:MAG: GNAT family N-acetyltransferase [Bacteroidales bacterium]|nr:GNAT family N-acetyltransferase [Bacteroidales bacterium]